MTIAIISHPSCELHIAGTDHPESSERVKVIQMALERYPFKTSLAYYQSLPATQAQLYATHDKSYVDWIYSIAPKEDMIEIDADTWMDPYSLTAALHAAGAVIMAVDLVMKREAEVAFCNVRPPGHHAENDKAMGFCLFNNVAVGVMHLLTHYQLERVAIIDFDVHHGNGTQNIFQRDKRVMYCSSFQHPFYPGYDEEMDNKHIIGVPLEAGTNGEIFRSKVEEAWFAKLAEFKPQFIFFSAGFDAHINDPLAQLELTEADYEWVTSQIAKIAKVHCDGRIVSVLEGGYDLDALAQSVPAHINAMII